MDNSTTPTLRAFGGRLRELRCLRKLTQNQLADRLQHVFGLQQPALSLIERGGQMPDAGQLEHILTALEATPEDAEEVRTLARVSRRRGAA